MVTTHWAALLLLLLAFSSLLLGDVAASEQDELPHVVAEPVSFRIDPIRMQRQRINHCWRQQIEPCVQQCDDERLLLSQRAGAMPVALLEQVLSAALYSYEYVCASYCQADVSWNCTQQSLDDGGTAVFKFGGRWPFRRWWIFSEPGSAIFSLLTVLVQAVCMWRFSALYAALSSRSASGQHGSWYPHYQLHTVGYIVWSAAFSFSCVFHTVDVPLTEYLDYAGAICACLFALFQVLVRLLDWPMNSKTLILCTPFVGFATFRLTRMLEKIDYGLHNKSCIALMVVQSLCWAAWAIKRWRAAGPHSRRSVLWIVLSQTGLLMFGLFELFDFAPLWGLVDSHGFYHLFAVLVFLALDRWATNDLYFYYERAAAAAHAKTE